MENETERTFLSCIKGKPKDDIVSVERTPGYFNWSRFCTLIRDGYLKALTHGDVIYGVVPTQKGLEW